MVSIPRGNTPGMPCMERHWGQWELSELTTSLVLVKEAVGVSFLTGSHIGCGMAGNSRVLAPPGVTKQGLNIQKGCFSLGMLDQPTS